MHEWSSPYSTWVYVVVAAAFAALIVVARRTAISGRLKSGWLFVPRTLVFLLLLWVLLNPVERREHRLPDQPAQVQYLVDASRSMALEQPVSRSLQAQQAIQIVDAQLQQSPDRPRVQLFRFGQELASAADLSQLRPFDNVTQLAEALEQLPSRFGRELPRGIVVFSDGVVDDAVELDGVASAFRKMGVPTHVFPLGSTNLRGDVALDELVVPTRVDAGVKAPVHGVVRGTGYAGERIVLQVRAKDRPELPPLATLPVTLSETPQPFEMIVEANPEYGELLLEAPPLEGEVSTRNNRIPFQLAKGVRKLKVLYMEGTGSNEYHWVHDALQEDKDIECVSLVADQQYVQRPRLTRVGDAYRGFPTTREELLQYDCVICSDISIGAFTPEQLEWTVELVDKRGGGFAMVGGLTSFGAGGWDQTTWDQLIPVDMKGGTIGRGWVYQNFSVTVPEEALSHPIWRIVEDPVQNRQVLAAMPQFGGTNYMQRLKPAAIVLGVSATPIPQAGIMPIFACQSYGRGRTFAFAPDTTADWGKWFESQWGENDNRYFRRFWRNTVRWLTENSSAGNKRLMVETDRVIYRAGQPIQIKARALDQSFKETIDYQLVARAKASPAATAVSLIPGSAGTGYTGELPTDTLGAGDADEDSSVLVEQEIEVFASHEGKEIARAVVRVMVLPDLHELIQPKAQPAVLEQLATATEGRTLRSPGDLVTLLQTMKPIQGDSIVSRQPLWDHPAVWMAVIVLLAIEWSMRRMSGFG